MKATRVVLAILLFAAATPAGAETTSNGTMKLAAACSLKTAKSCHDWCVQNGRIGRSIAVCVKDCARKYPGC